MSGSLFDQNGMRKYLVSKEREAFLSTARNYHVDYYSFCLTLAVTGARISEVLALTSEKIDRGNNAIIFETLKQRRKGVYRAVPVPSWLLIHIPKRRPSERLWHFGRTTAWKTVKYALEQSGAPSHLSNARALRHSFAVEAVLRSVPLNVVQRWMGHARLETTSIYAAVVGDEERQLARRTWKIFEHALGAKPRR
jgi:integrase/recombinase XerD